MARHRARSLGMIGSALAIGMALVLVSTSAGSAQAATARGKSAKMSNFNVKGACNFTLQSLNPSDGTVIARIAAQAQPNNGFGWSRNRYTQVVCDVFDNYGDPLTEWAPFRSGPYLPNTSTESNLPFTDSYVVCGYAWVRLSNGSTSYTGYVCA